MKTYQYTSPENTVVHVFDEDGISRMSMLASLVPEGEVILPYVAPPPPVPASISPSQLRRALNATGLRSAVEAMVAQADQDTKDWYEFATAFERNHPLVIQFGLALGQTEEQLDALWILGGSL